MAEKIGLSAVLELQNWSKNVTKYTGDISKMEKASSGFGSRVGNHFAGVGKAIAGVGLAAGAAAAAAGAAVGAFVVSGISKAADLEAAMSGIAAALNKSAEEVKPLKDLIMDLALDPNLVVNTTEAASAIENLAKNGLSMTQIMDGAARSTVLLANATGADFGMAADIASDTMAIFNIEAANMGEAVDGITGVTNASKFTIDDYRLALAQAGAVANMVGVEFDDFNTTIAAISPNFASGSDAGTSLKTMLANIIPKSADARTAMSQLGLMTFDAAKAMEYLQDNGVKPAGTDMETLMGQIQKVYFSLHKELNPTTDEGVKAFAKFANGSQLMSNAFFDANGNLKDMADISAILHEATKDLSEEQMNMAMTTIFGSDAIRAAGGVADSGAVAYRTASEAAKALGVSIDEAAKFAEGGITKFEAMEISIAKIDAEEQAATRMKNFRGVLMILQGAIEAVQIMIGDAFLPVLTELAKMANELVGAYGPALTKVFQDFGGALTKLFDDLKNGKAPFDAFMEALKSIGVDTGFATQISAIALGIGAIGLAAGAVLQPVISAIGSFVEWKDVLIVLAGAIATIVVPAIAGLVVAMAPIILTIGGAILAVAALRTAWENDWLGIQTKTTEAVSAIQTAFLPLTTALATHGAGALIEIQNFASGTQTEFTNLSAIWEGLRTSVEGVFTGIVSTIQTNLPTWQATLTEWGLAASAWIIEAATTATTGLATYTTALVGGINAQLPAWTAAFDTWILAASDWIVSAVGPAVSSLTQWISGLTAGLANQLPSWQKAFTDWTLAASEWIIESIGPAVSAFAQWMSGLLAGLARQYPSWQKAFVTWTVALWQWISEATGPSVKALGEWLGDLIAWMPTGVVLLTTEALKLGTALLTWISGKATSDLPAKMGAWAGQLVAQIPLAIARLVIEAAKLGAALIGWIAGGGGISVSDSATGKIGPEFAKFTAALGAGITAAWAGFQSFVVAFGQSFWDEIGKNVDWIALGSAITGGIQSGVEMTAATLVGVFQKIAQEAYMIVFNTDWLGLGRDIITFIKSGVAGLAGDIISEMGRIAKAALAAFLDVDWIGLGKSVIDGIVSGLKKNATDVIDFLTSLAGDSIGAAMDKLQGKSPSKEFEKIGGYIIAGWVIGMEKGRRTLLSSVGSLAQNTISAAADALGVSSPSTEFARIGYEIVHGWIRGMEQKGTALYLAVERLGLGVARTAGRAGADAANVFVDALGGFQGLGDSRLDEVKEMFEEASLLAGTMAGMQGSEGAAAMWGQRSSELGKTIHQFEKQNELLEEQQNILEMMQTIQSVGGSVPDLMGGFVVGDDIAVDPASQVKLSARMMEMLNQRLHKSLMMSVKGFTQSAQQVQASAEKALSGFGETAREKANKLVEEIFNPDTSTESSRGYIHDLRIFADQLGAIKNELSFMAKQRFSADSIIEGMVGEFDQLEHFKKQIEGFDGEIADLQDRVMETGDVALLTGIKTLDAKRNLVTSDLRSFLHQSKQAELAVEGFGETVQENMTGIIQSIYMTPALGNRSNALKNFNNFVNQLFSIRSQLDRRAPKLDVGGLIDRATSGFDQMKSFEQMIGSIDAQAESLQNRILETGDQGLLSQLFGLDAQRSKVEGDLQRFIVQFSNMEAQMRRIKTVGQAGQTSIEAFISEQIKPIQDAFDRPMRAEERDAWLFTMERRVDAANRFVDQMRVVEKIQASIEGKAGFETLSDEFATLQDINIPESTRLALMRNVQAFIEQMNAVQDLEQSIVNVPGFDTLADEFSVLRDFDVPESARVNLQRMVQTYIQQIKQFQAAQRDLTVGTGADPIVARYKTERLDTIEERLRDINISEAERAQLITQYRMEQEKILAIQQKQQQLTFLEQQLGLLEKLRQIDDEEDYVINIEKILGGIRFGMEAGMDDLLLLTGRTIDEMVKLTNRKLQIRSPSKVFAEIGSYMMQGLAQGIDSTMMMPLRSMATAVSNVAQPAISNRSVNINMGGVAISNGMDETMFRAMIRQEVGMML